MGIPLIALQGQPPPQQDLLGEAGKAMQLKALKGQMAEQPGQLQIQKQQIEMQQRALDDQKAQTAAMQEWIGSGSSNFNELPGLLVKHGGSANAVFSLKQQLLDQQTKIAALDEKNLKIHQDHVKAFGDAAQSVLALPDELQQAAYQQKTRELVSNGTLKPQEVPPFSKDNVRMIAAESMGMKNLLDTEAENKLKAAQLLKAQSEATIAQQESKLTPQERAGLKNPGQAEMADWLTKNPGKGPADYEKWKASLAPQAQINVQGGAPGNELAQAVASGQMKIGDVLTMRTPLPLRKQFLNQVLAINPNFKSYDFDIEKGVSKAFTSGAEAKNLTAFNTAIEHAKQLHAAAEALNVGDMRTMNKIGNALGYEFGSDKTTNFNVIKNALSGEISKVFKGGQATDAEIKAVQEPFDAANSPAQLKGAIRNAISLMNSKRDALKKQYEAGKQAKPNFGEEIGGTIRARDTNGQLHEAPAGTKLPPGWKLEQ